MPKQPKKKQTSNVTSRDLGETLFGSMGRRGTFLPNTRDGHAHPELARVSSVEELIEKGPVVSVGTGDAFGSFFTRLVDGGVRLGVRASQLGGFALLLQSHQPRFMAEPCPTRRSFGGPREFRRGQAAEIDLSIFHTSSVACWVRR